ncbi:unnamed protein product [Allacma fusca]|uniref:G-protein coupled receptors family 1 profile domain-containing protein n=1 Tax=Allacma fusca TaxID=39272 RepID=A0A8J2J6J1_9HEXA|nr:unnamed protein product [Allacma fusca]
MYHFINSLSYTASILILVVICIERYLAIIHPIRSRQILTINRLRYLYLHVSPIPIPPALPPLVMASTQYSTTRTQKISQEFSTK